MPDISSDSLGPNIGLSSIELSDGIDEPELPIDSGVDPIDSSVEESLANLLEAKNFEWVMLDSIRPQVQDSGILKPGHFHGIRRDIVEKIGSLDAGGMEPEVVEELKDLLALLEKLAADHELGEHYRYALLKG